MDSPTPCPVGVVCEVLLHPACLPRRNARRHLLRAPLPGAQEVRLKKDPRAQDVRREDGAERAGRDGRNPPPRRRRHCGGTAAVAAVPARLPPSHRTPTSRAARASTVTRRICARKARPFIYLHTPGGAREAQTTRPSKTRHGPISAPQFSPSPAIVFAIPASPPGTFLCCCSVFCAAVDVSCSGGVGAHYSPGRRFFSSS